MMILGALALMSSVHTAWAGYKPVDVSDIQGEQRKQLAELARDVGRMPAQSRDCFLCEQLGLCFAADGSQVMWCKENRLGTTASKAFFVGRSGRPLPFAQAYKGTPVWGKCYEKNHQINQTKPGALLSFFKKDVDRVVHNTAKYLMNEMPDDLRWSLLAMLDRKLYYQDGRSASEKKHEFSLECGIKVSYYYGEGDYQNCYFVGANGEEAKVEDARRKKGHGERHDRWYHIVLRCANLVGNKDILALFPEEVKAMRRHYKQRLTQVKEQKDATINEAIEQADAMLQTLPSDAQERLIAEAAGMYYDPENYEHNGTDWKTGTIWTKGALYLGNGSKVYGPCNGGDAPVVRELLRKVPHRVILERYAEPLKKMARYMARDRFQNMPGTLRDALRCVLTGKLTTVDGSPAVDGETTMNLEVPDPARKTVPIPCAKVNADKARFTTSRGITLPYSTIKSYLSQYARSVQLVHLCALILGPEEIAKCIPQGGEEEKEELPKTPQKSATGSTTNEQASVPTGKSETPQKTASDGSIRNARNEGTNAEYARGVSALRRMKPDELRAWIAVKLGLCFDVSGFIKKDTKVHEIKANFLDSQGVSRGVNEVVTSETDEWAIASEIACQIGAEALSRGVEKEVAKLAYDTAVDILSKAPTPVRLSWFAEMNRMLFRADGSSPYPAEKKKKKCFNCCDVEIQYWDIPDNGLLLCSPDGNLMPVTRYSKTKFTRYYDVLQSCENILGIEAINAAFKAEVDAMRVAYEKSSFLKK